MNWTKLLYVLIIVLLYIPMVFLGANVFFPQYTGTDSYFHGYTDCYQKYPYPADPDKATTVQRAAIDENQRACQEEYNKAQQEWEQARLKYEGMKYIFIALFNLVI